MSTDVGGMEGVTHVFLDVGGTILRSEPSPAEIFQRALAARGHPIERESVARLLRTPETIVALIRPLAPERMVDFYRAINARLVEHLGFASDEAMLDEIHEQFAAPVTWRPFPEAPASLRGLRDAGYRLGVISNASHDLPEILRSAGLARYFDTLTYSADVGAEKPHARIFHRALAQSGAEASKAVHVGDQYEADYLGARNAGLHAVLVTREREPPAPCPHVRTLADLRDLLGGRRSPR
jgi:putative hydrolase of the HAD superfamily